MSDEKPIDQTPDTHSKRIRFGQTETSRLKTAGAGKTNQDDTTLPTTAKPVPKPAPGRTSVVDPMTLRDTNTSKVKRVQAARDSSPLATVSLPGAGGPLRKTETVQLKVVQQKKKELDQDMNPASTVRLKAPGGAAGPSISIPKPRPGAVPRDTMKISLPTLDKKEVGKADSPQPAMGDSPTVQVKPVTPPPVPSHDTATAIAAETEKPATVKTSTTVLERVKPKTRDEGSADETASSVSSETAKTVAVPKADGGRTLKIRGGKSARTIKVKSDTSAKTIAVDDLPDSSDEAKMVKVDDVPPGLKLKSRQQPLGEAAIAGPAPLSAVTGKGRPGILYTLGAVASLVALGVTVSFTLTQVLKYIF
ncbi:MAG: hypothetical protein RRC34_14030 [Lentisphaeria bacterium]|nr:hypothetical protein [Lentisphaeria bacterium]